MGSWGFRGFRGRSCLDGVRGVWLILRVIRRKLLEGKLCYRRRWERIPGYVRTGRHIIRLDLSVVGAGRHCFIS